MTTGFDPSDYQFSIFNQWGELIFVTNDYAVGWDGTYQGKIIQDGTYVWVINFKHISEDNRYFKKGSVTLFR